MNRRRFLDRAGRAALAAGMTPMGLGALGGGRADLVLHDAVVYDGTGAPPVRGDVVLTDGRISAIRGVADAAYATGTEVVDLHGLALAPGFVDIHSHADLALLVEPRAESAIRQGITTVIVGQDGSSIGPWSEEEHRSTRERYRDRYGVDLDFRDLAGFFDRLGRDPASINVASMVGAGTVRRAVLGMADRRPTTAELERMRELVREALDAGACGLSTGLEYTPGGFAERDELTALASVLRGTGLPYASHMRNEDDDLLSAIEEALNVGRGAGVPVQISHLKAQGRRNWWKAEPVLKVLESARAAGIDVLYDRYPYIAYSTGLTSLFPIRAREGGIEAFLGRLEDPTHAGRIEAEVRAKIEKLGSWDAVQVTGTDSDALAWARGRRLGELASERGAEPYALLLELIRRDRGGSGMVGFGMDEENTARFLAHPLGMVCSDGSALAPYGPLSEGTPHPRAYGTFPRVLGHYVRREALMPLETAIHKMTGMPAARVGLRDRGRIAVGAAADIVVFDPDRIADRATFEAPHQYPVGIAHVLVNGRFTVRNGEHLGTRRGRALRP